MTDKPQCELCAKRPASVHYTEIADARVAKLFICKECAATRGLLEEPAPDLEALMSTISKSKESPGVAPLECPQCGLTFQQFQKGGQLGCPGCYTAFRDPLLPLLRGIHKHVRHGGRKPRISPAREQRWQRLAEIKSALELAIRTEDYERAARLRDEIRDLQAESGEAAPPEPEAGGGGGASS